MGPSVRKVFKQEKSSFKGEKIFTPYQRAKREWDVRLGSARVQARNWRIVALCSVGVSLLLLAALLIVLLSRKEHIYVAEVTKEGRVTNVAPLMVKYQPTEAQKHFFITRFIELTRTVPLDPVLAKKNWISAYRFLTSRGVDKLNGYFRQNNPVALLGKGTISVQVLDINPVTPTTTHVNWAETLVDSEGKEAPAKEYSGVFTTVVKQPTNQQGILQNPLGLYIVDFDISSKESFKKVEK